MNTNLMNVIAAATPSFSKGQRRIAQYITEHYDEASFMTAARLGDKVGVSESTVVRFATQLGFDGYPGLQKAMQELIRSKLTLTQRLEVSRARVGDGEVLREVATADIHNIRQTLEEMDTATFDRAVDIVCGARRVYVFGAGSCKALAAFLNHYLQMLLGGTQLITAASQSEIFEEMLTITPQDAVIGISFPRYSKKAAKTLHYAHSKGVPVVAITDSILSPIAPYANALLLAHSDMASIVDSLTAPMSIINALIVAVSLRTMDRNADKLEELERLWKAYGVYETMDETET